MRKILVIMIVAIVTLSSCTKDTVTSGQDAHVYPQYLNTKRIASIEGTNALYGEYNWKYTYDDFNVLVAGECTIGNDVVVESLSGTLSATRENIIYSHIKRVINLHSSEIPAFEDELIAEHGAGNYSLQEELYKSRYDSRVVLAVNHSMYSDGRASSTTYSYNERVPLASDALEDFSTEYEETQFINAVYEYNLDGLVSILRMADYQYSADGDSQRNLKYNFSYSGLLPVAATVSELMAGENYSVIGDLSATYANGRLSNVKFNANDGATSWEESYVNSGNSVKYTDEDGVVHTYTLDSEGYVTEYVNSNGESAKYTYEPGNGTFGVLENPLNKLLGVPHIK